MTEDGAPLSSVHVTPRRSLHHGHGTASSILSLGNVSTSAAAAPVTSMQTPRRDVSRVPLRLTEYPDSFHLFEGMAS